MKAAQTSQNMFGRKQYQERARRVFPILVRQARAKEPIFYAHLAEELDMPNARNLDYVLGSIGRSLLDLSDAWERKIPPIQCLVINQHKRLPGEGISWFLDNDGLSGVSMASYDAFSLVEKRTVVVTELQRIYAFRDWNKILEEFGLPSPFAPIANKENYIGFWGGGESDAHKKLKKHVAENPKKLKLPKKMGFGRQEVNLLSGDKLDVSFRGSSLWYACEVKSELSNIADIQRGIFQCVKYRAVMRAMDIADGVDAAEEVVLVLEGKLPVELVALKNTLGVGVIENFYSL